ncbi:ABC transporter ATP-binding protein [Anaerosporobacter sp.]|uniref:ABC transporter ATP-binding protein n=1 Tax=Anaerosporobacter sp. TaxID=1872529 RepID=UPI0025D1DF9A|nr:ABC transporter ATP-binding protein [Anaerosporobacter sp.]
MPLLQVKDLEVAFEKEHEELVFVDKVNFHVDEGEILCIVGESGCGKSVTALSIMGLLGQQGRVKSGEVLFNGRDLLKLKEKELDQIRGNEIAMVFQDVMNCLNPSFTVGNQMAEAIRIHLGYDKKKTKEHAIQLLEKVGLPDAKAVMKKYPHMLSGGMRQRVMIAMALICRPKLLIADEPTTALDVTIQLQIMKLLLELRDEYHMSILLITHDIGVVAEEADRVVVMYAGQCVEETDVNSLFKKPAHPYTEALLQSVPTIYGDPTRKLKSIPGTVPENYQELEGCRFADRCSYATKECYTKQEYHEVEPGHLVRCWKELLNNDKQ